MNGADVFVGILRNPGMMPLNKLFPVTKRMHESGLLDAHNQGIRSGLRWKFLTMIIIFVLWYVIHRYMTRLWYAQLDQFVMAGYVFVNTSVTSYNMLKLISPLIPHIYVAENPTALVQIMACRLFRAKPLCWFIVNWTIRNKFQWNSNQNAIFLFTKMHLRISSVKWWPFCPGEMR